MTRTKGIIKTQEEIKALRSGGELLSRILGKAVRKVKPGANTAELDDFAKAEILKSGGKPAFLGYITPGVRTPFNSVICMSINNEVVHGLAHPGRILKEGDIIGLDAGMRHPAKDGFFTDMAVTVPVGKITPAAERLIRVTRESLERAIAIVRPGARISDIGKTVQQHVEKNNFGVVRALVGHGVGYAVHEDPPVPNYFDPGYPDMVLKEGMVLALEPMVTAGSWKVKTLDDDWTVVTADGKLAAHWEVTIAVTKEGCEILTPLPV